MADDLFAGTDQSEPSIDPNKKVLDDLVGEGKKYSDPEALARAALHKDAFIEQLKRENAEMREAAQKRANEEEFLAKLAQVTRQSPSLEQDTLVERDNQEAAVTPVDIEAIVEKKLAARQETAKRDANLSEVSKKLQETYGDGYRAHVQKQSQALGMTTQELTEYAAKSPAAFYRLIGLDQQQTQNDVFAPPRSSVNLQPGPRTGVKDFDYWRAQRREKGDGWYFSVPVQQEIWRAAQELGPNFKKD